MILASLVVVSAGTAFGQSQNPGLPLGSPGELPLPNPGGAPRMGSPVQRPMVPPGNAATAGVPVPMSPGGVAPNLAGAGAVDSSGAARMPPQPQGGWEGGPDKANLAGADNYVKTLESSASQKLNQMTNGAVAAQGSNGQLNLPSGMLPSADPQNTADLADLQNVQRQISLLEHKNRLAEIAVKYWTTVFDSSSAREWRAEDQKRADAQQARLDKIQEASLALTKPAGQGGAPGRPGAQATPAPPPAPVSPMVFDVENGKAQIITSAGTVVARTGTKLPDGSKVIKVSIQGVVVENEGKQTTLGFYQASGARR